MVLGLGDGAGGGEGGGVGGGGGVVGISAAAWMALGDNEVISSAWELVFILADFYSRWGV